MRKSTSRKTAFVWLIAIAWLLSCPALRARQKSWLLEQNHYSYADLKTYVLKDGVKVVCTKNDFEFSCSKPEWDMLLYSEKRKLLCKRPYSDWSKRGIKTALVIQNLEALHNWPRVIVRESTPYAGVNARLYAFPGKSSTGRPMSLKYGKFGEYIVTDALACHENVAKFLQALFDLPPDRGVPLRFCRFGKANSYGFGLKYNQKEDVTEILSTKRVVPIKQVRVGPVMPLSAFKTVLESDIVINKGDFSEFFQEMTKPRKPEKKN